MTGAECPVCGSDAPEGFLRRGGVPAHQNLVMRDPGAALAAERGDLDLACCPRCGFVFNRAFDPARLSYGADYDNTQTCSPSFRGHVEGLVRHLVDERGVRGCRIVEVGCGQGDFLVRLVQAAGEGATGVGFDPAYTGPDTVLDGRVRFERRFYGPECADVPADVVVCRHVIEHVPRPVELLRSVRAALEGAGRARVYFETPTVEWILRHRVVWDFFYEHCSYFSAASLSTAFQAAGFAVDEVREVFGGQYLWIEGSAGGPAPEVEMRPGEVPGLARAFSQAEPRIRGSLRAQVERWAADGGVALWGAGAKGATLAALMDPDRRLVRCVVDLNPQKQGRYLPATGHPIVDYRALAGLGVRTAVLMNPNYRAENERLLREAGLDVALTELTEPTHARGD